MLLHGSSFGIVLAAVSGTLIDVGVSVGCNVDSVIVMGPDVGLSRLTN